VINIFFVLILLIPSEINLFNSAVALSSSCVVRRVSVFYRCGSSFSEEFARGMRSFSSNNLESDGYTHKRIIRSVSDAIEVVTKDIRNPEIFNPCELKPHKYPFKLPFPFGIWYRGERDFKFNLQPTLFRSLPSAKQFDESSIFHNFRLENPEQHKSVPDNFSWLTLMQHHGAPTRLLDWSESLLTALYFAVSGVKDQTEAKLTVLNAVRLNNVVLGNYSVGVCPQDWLAVVARTELMRSHSPEDLFDYRSVNRHEEFIKLRMREKKDNEQIIKLLRLDYPVAVSPLRFHARLKVQSGTFTIHGGKPNHSSFSPKSIEDVNKEQIHSGKPPVFIRYTIQEASRILEELRLLGINEHTLMCDIDSKARHIANTWTVERA
jgi:hypothetical protein